VVQEPRHRDDLVPGMCEYLLEHPSGGSVHVRPLLTSCFGVSF
jgi:hypothetical protein